MFFRRRVEPPMIEPVTAEPEPVAVPSVIQVSMADKAAEVIVIESIKTVMLRVTGNGLEFKTDADRAAFVETAFADFREHLKQHGYHMEIFI